MKYYAFRIMLISFALTVFSGCGNFFNEYLADVKLYRIAAAVDGGYIYTSPDSGQTWVERTSAGSRNWRSIASSADGVKLIACVGVEENLLAVPPVTPAVAGYVYISKDSGNTWVQQDAVGSYIWKSVSCSYDGTVIAAATGLASGTAYIKISRNGGASWYTLSDSNSWTSVAVSGNGEIIYGTINNSTYYQITWNGSAYVFSPAYSVGSSNLKCIATSYDGNVAIVSFGSDNGVFISNNPTNISSWVHYQLYVTAGVWDSVAVSADGNRFGAVSNVYDLKYFPTNDSKWGKYSVYYDGFEILGWKSISIASDGFFRAASGTDNFVWISNDAGISWNPCLSSGDHNWTAVTVSKYSHPY